jgi:HK97 family phage major capsid protein
MTKETKMAGAADTKAMTHDLLARFDAFKATNDARLAAIETRKADVLIDEKLARIDRAITEQKQALDRITLDASRPGLDASARATDPARSQSWQLYLRKGDDSGLARLDTKALNTATDSEGGYAAPAELDRMIEARLMASSAIRPIVTVRQTSAGVFKKPVSLGAGASWVGEAAARPETAAPNLSLLEFPAAELYAMPAATQTLLDDTYVDVDEWIAEEVETAFLAQESAAFVTGNGISRPKGFLSYDTVADSAHVWGKVGFVTSGAAGDFAATDPANALIDLVYAPKAQYRTNARFAMNRRTVSAVRKLKDGDGNYIWQPGAAGEASTLMGYAVSEIEDMPDIAADAFSIAFGDFRRFYLIVDRQGARVLRDPYSAKPYVLFYTTKRVGGGIQNFEAVKLMKFAAT